MRYRVLPIIAVVGALCLGEMIAEPLIAQEAAPPRSETPAVGVKAPPVVKITGQYADQITVALLSLLSYSYYLTGEFEFSRQYAEQAIAQYQSLKNPLQGEGLETQVYRAKDILSWIERWKKEPILCEPRELRIAVYQTEPILRRLVVRSLGNIPLIVSSDNEKIKFRVEDEGSQKEYYFEKEVVMEIVPEALSGSFDAMLVIRSPKFADFQVRVPVYVEIPRPIRLSMESVFFGWVKTGETPTRTLSLWAPVPFRVIKVESDDKNLEILTDTVASQKNHKLDIKFYPKKAKNNKGQIRILTDFKGQEIINVPYYAYVP